MLIQVGDPGLDLGLNLCFFAIVALTVAAILPWRAWGLERLARAARWLPLPVFALAYGYEVLMPNRFDIRVDLLLLLPMYLAVLIASALRWRRPKAAAGTSGGRPR